MRTPSTPTPTSPAIISAARTRALTMPKLEVWSNSGKRSWWEPFTVERHVAAGDADPLRLQIQQFCRVVTGNEAPLVTGREGLKTLAVIEAVKKAAATSRPVEVT